MTNLSTYDNVYVALTAISITVGVLLFVALFFIDVVNRIMKRNSNYDYVMKINGVFFKKAVRTMRENQQSKVSNFFQRILFYYLTIFVICCCIFIFWNELLVTQSVDCDVSLDCFPFDVDTNYPLQNYPLTDCTLQSSTNVTVICYQFVFRYVEAIGSVGGVLAFAKLTTNVYVIVISWLLGNSSSTLEKRIKGVLVVLSLCSFVFLPFAVFVAILVVSYISFLKMTVLKTNASAEKFYMYILLFFHLSVITPLVLMLKEIHLIKLISECKTKCKTKSPTPGDQEPTVTEHSNESYI